VLARSQGEQLVGVQPKAGSSLETHSPPHSFSSTAQPPSEPASVVPLELEELEELEAPDELEEEALAPEDEEDDEEDEDEDEDEALVDEPPAPLDELALLEVDELALLDVLPLELLDEELVDAPPIPELVDALLVLPPPIPPIPPTPLLALDELELEATLPLLDELGAAPPAPASSAPGILLLSTAVISSQPPIPAIITPPSVSASADLLSVFMGIAQRRPSDGSFSRRAPRLSRPPRPVERTIPPVDSLAIEPRASRRP
jgi:hypothetical protein